MNQPPVGAIPAGFTKTGDVGVEEGVAHSGKHALRIEPAVRGGRYISLAPDKVAALGGEHWGRLYFKVKTPTPLPTGRLIHATLVDGKGISPLANDLIDVRLATLLFYPSGDFGWFYNVQPPNGRKEFGPKSATMQKFNDEWQLLEWHVDAATQTYAFFVNGKEVADIGQHKGAGNLKASKFPPHSRPCRSGLQITSLPPAKALRSGSMTSPSARSASVRCTAPASRPIIAGGNVYGGRSGRIFPGLQARRAGTAQGAGPATGGRSTLAV